MAQIVKNKDYKYGSYYTCYCMFLSKTTRHWFLIKLRKLLGLEWSLRKRKDGMSELSQTGFTPVKIFLM